jgi:hypothetical protein
VSALELLFAVRRQWLVAVAGVVVTLGAMLWAGADRGLYWSQVDVLFAAPQSGEGNALMAAPETLIATAGVIQRDVTGARATSRVVSDSVTLVSQGVRRGVSVRIPNAGGQWANNFDRPVLDVEVVDETPAAAQARLQQVLADIADRLAARQRAAGVADSNLISIRLLPDSPTVEYVSGSPPRAMAMTGVLCIALTLGLIWGVEARRNRAVASRTRPLTR